MTEKNAIQFVKEFLAFVWSSTLLLSINTGLHFMDVDDDCHLVDWLLLSVDQRLVSSQPTGYQLQLSDSSPPVPLRPKLEHRLLPRWPGVSSSAPMPDLPTAHMASLPSLRLHPIQCVGAAYQWPQPGKQQWLTRKRLLLCIALRVAAVF